MMDDAANRELDMLKQIDCKLDALLERLVNVGFPHTTIARPDFENNSRRDRATKIAALTPTEIRQTDAVELLHQDRSR